MQHVLVGLLDRMQDDFVAHEAAIHKHILLVGLAFAVCGFGNIAVQLHQAIVAINGQGRIGKVLPDYRRHAFGQILYRQLVNAFLIVRHVKCHIGATQGYALDGGEAMRPFGVVGF